MITRLFAATLIATAAAVPAHAGYRFVTIDARGANVLGTAVAGINDYGLATGFVTVALGATTVDSGFTVNADGSGFTLFGRAGFVQTSPNAINNAGTIAGVSLQATDAGAIGFIRTVDGSYTNVDPASGGIASVFSEATGLDNRGTVVGFYTAELTADPQATPVHGFIDRGGAFTTFDVPADVGQQTQLLSINASGTLAGTYYGLGADSLNIHGFLWSPGGGFVYPDRGIAPGSEVRAVNDAGDFIYADVIVDAASPLGYDAAGYFVHGGVFTPVAVPGAFTTEPLGLNNLGQVTGAYLDRTGVHGFIAQPVPEPASWALMLTGFGFTGAMARRRGAQVVTA